MAISLSISASWFFCLLILASGLKMLGLEFKTLSDWLLHPLCILCMVDKAITDAEKLRECAPIEAGTKASIISSPQTDKNAGNKEDNNICMAWSAGMTRLPHN